MKDEIKELITILQNLANTSEDRGRNATNEFVSGHLLGLASGYEHCIDLLNQLIRGE